VASRTGTLPWSLVRRSPPDIYGSDSEAEDTVTDSFRWGGRHFLDRPSFPSVAKSTLDVSRRVLDTLRSATLSVARNALAFVSPRPGTTAVALAVFCTSTYCVVGYLHYQRAARDERVAAQRAERANADLQDALDRLRDELAVTKARNDTLDDEGTREIAVSEQYKADRIAQYTLALEQSRDLRLTDMQRPIFAAGLSWKAAEFADEQAKQWLANRGLDQSQIKLQQLSAERDEAVGERDELQARVSELEQELLLLQSRRGPPRVAKVATTRKAPPARPPETSAAIVPASPPAAVVPPAEHPRQVAVVFPTRNFTPPVWVPTNFSNESAPIREKPTRRPAEINTKE
jgi:hypothetical protein